MSVDISQGDAGLAMIGVVAIGRDEGERLRRCLALLVGRDLEVVYTSSTGRPPSPQPGPGMRASSG